MRPDLRPDPRWGSSQRSPRPPAGLIIIRGPLRGRERRGTGREEEKEEEGKVDGWREEEGKEGRKENGKGRRGRGREGGREGKGRRGVGEGWRSGPRGIDAPGNVNVANGHVFGIMRWLNASRLQAIIAMIIKHWKQLSGLNNYVKRSDQIFSLPKTINKGGEAVVMRKS